MFYLSEQIEEASDVLAEMEQKGVKTLDVRDNKKIKDLKKNPGKFKPPNVVDNLKNGKKQH